MATYETLPKQVEAFQYNGLPSENGKLVAWFSNLSKTGESENQLRITGDTPQKVILTTPLIECEIAATDWLICNKNGVIFMANDEAFEEYYVFVEEIVGEFDDEN